MTRARQVQLWGSVLAGALCLWFAFRDVPFAETSESIRRVPIWVYATYLLAMVLQFVLRSLRWSVQARGQSGRQPSLRESLAINGVSFAAVFFLPFRLGELVRPYLGAQRGWMRKTTGIAHSAVERIVDGLVTTAFFAVVLLWLGDRQLPPEVAYAGWAALFVFGGASLVLGLGLVARRRSQQFWLRALSLIHRGLAQRLVAMLEAFLDGVAALSSPTDFARYLGFSVAYWVLNGLSMWLILWGMGIDAGPAAAFFTLCFLVIGVMLPAPPGNVGNFHAFAKWALTLLGVAEAPALAYAVVLHAGHVVALLVWSAFFLLRGDISVAGLKEATRGDRLA